MSEQTDAFRKVFEAELFQAESMVKFYRGLLGMPPVEIESLKSQLQEKTEKLDNLSKINSNLLHRAAQEKSENEVLHRKVDDLTNKLCKAHRECAKLRNELKAAREEFSAYLNKNIKSTPPMARSKAELYDELLDDASDCLVGSVIGIKHEPNDLEPDEMFYFLRITKDEAYRIDMGGYAHLEVWED